MELIDVYRVETDWGGGPYIGANVHVSCGGAKSYSTVYQERHPSPYYDGTLMQGPPTQEQAESYDWKDYRASAGEHPAIGIGADERCGFWSLTQLRAWFDHPGNRARLEEVGHGITHYKVPADALRYGRRQVVYKKDLATKYARIGFDGVLALD